MVLFKCLKCNKMFNKKSTFIIHTEHKKKPCKIYNDIVALDLQLAEKKALDLRLTEKEALDLQQKHNFLNNIEDLKDIYKKEENIITNKDDNNVNKCDYCYKIFVKKYGLNRHLKLCNIKNDITEILKKENEELKNEQKIKDDLIFQLKIENEKLNNTITNNSTIINNSVINNNNININIVNYREEDFSKLDLKKILTYDNSFIEMVFRDIHCNPELPENQNILLPSLTRYDIYVKLNNEWLKRNKKEILTERYTTIRSHIMDLYDKESNINKNKADNVYFHFLKQIKLVDPSNVIYKPKEEKKIIDGMANVLYNHKDNIKSIDKVSFIIKKNI